MHIAEYLPEYDLTPEVRQLLLAADSIFNRGEEGVTQLLHAAYPHPDSDPGPVLLERLCGMLGITGTGDENTRLRQCVAKLRTARCFTRGLVSDIVGAFTEKGIELDIEPEAYTIRVRFTGDYGVPAFLNQLQERMDSARPAHVLVEYVLNWQKIGNFDARLLADMDPLTFDELSVWSDQTLA